MATLDQIANDYANLIRANKENPGIPLEIATRINSLTYTESGDPISTADKERLLESLKKRLSHKREAPGGRGFIIEAEDSTVYLQFVAQVENIIKNGERS